MNASNLPPGCSVGDIPGNTSEDVAWDKLIEDIGGSGLSAVEARQRWETQPKLLEAAKAQYENMRIIADLTKRKWTARDQSCFESLGTAIKKAEDR